MTLIDEEREELTTPAATQVDLAVSTVVFALRPHPVTGEATVWLPLVRRIREPFLGQWALPGGPLAPEDDLTTSAAKSLNRTTGLKPRYLEQLYAFGKINRSPDRVVSIVYWALVRADEEQNASLDENVEWFVADEVPALAFDHNDIVSYALTRLRSKITWSPIAHGFLNDEFTLAELRSVHEAVLGRQLDPANFRRQLLAEGMVEATGSFVTGTSHRPPALYRFVPRNKRNEP